MTAFAAGAPCWADVMLPDLAAGKRFYGGLLGWTFAQPDPDRHDYTMALHEGKAVAALMAKPDGRMPTAWNVYFASPDAAATAAGVRAAGGQVIAGPEAVGTSGTMLVAADPSGGVFGVWQAGDNAGFEDHDGPGSFCWTELSARDTAAVDPFYASVFGYRGEQLGEAGGEFDYMVWTQGDEREKRYVGGRIRMGSDVPAEMPSHFTLYFGVDDCDAAVEAVRGLGGRVDREPQDSPHGRLAAVTDDQGAHFTLIDRSRATEQP
jgi:uncharacterized protein